MDLAARQDANRIASQAARLTLQRQGQMSTTENRRITLIHIACSEARRRETWFCVNELRIAQADATSQVRSAMANRIVLRHETIGLVSYECYTQ